MQMWMVWMIWIVFLAVMFGLLADAVSECKGYAKSWFYAGLFLGPIALLILLRKKDPEGQVQYVDTRNAMPQEPRLMRDPATGMMVPSMLSGKIQMALGYTQFFWVTAMISLVSFAVVPLCFKVKSLEETDQLFKQNKKS